MEKGAQQPIIIKRKKAGHGHHGGGWKVALADFMTAMMAFFLLMWLMGTTTKETQKAISGYFNDPASEYAIGEGGSNPGLIEMDQPQKESSAEDPTLKNSNDKDNALDSGETTKTDGANGSVSGAGAGSGSDSAIAMKKEAEKAEREKLEKLEQQMKEQIDKAEVFQEVKDQVLIDFTALGLRIQIVDKDKRPMFDLGSAHLKDYSDAVLKALAPLLNRVPNKISITGHTDAKPYGAGATYTNWELSADRANAARRALLAGDYPEGKVASVEGMGSSAPYLVDDIAAPINRRIAIILLKKSVSDALTNGARGINSGDILKAPTDEPAEHVMTQKEVDEAVDRKSLSK